MATTAQNIQHMTAADLVDQDTYNALHSHGNIARIEGEVYHSSTFTDIVIVETEFGSLYLPEDIPVEALTI